MNCDFLDGFIIITWLYCYRVNGRSQTFTQVVYTFTLAMSKFLFKVYNGYDDNSWQKFYLNLSSFILITCWLFSFPTHTQILIYIFILRLCCIQWYKDQKLTLAICFYTIKPKIQFIMKKYLSRWSFIFNSLHLY